MRISKRFIIELMIAIGICAVMTVIFRPMWHDRNLTDYQRQQKREALQREYANVGVRCIGGYKFVQTDFNNPPVQIKNENGNGIPCQ